MVPPSRPFFDLTDRVAIVTGGAQGLGEAIARALADHGARVAIFDINPATAAATAKGIVAAGRDARVFECDVQDDGQVNRCVAQVLDQYGRLDILVNSAGIHRRHTPFDFPREDIDLLLRVNLMGSFFMARAAAKPMIARRSGSVINLSALGGGVVGLGRGGSIYGATKGGINALTRDLAAEWGKYGVRVNAIAPGWIRTPMSEALQRNEVQTRKVMERVPMGRWGEPEEIAGPAVFLASDAARFITGVVFPVDGGAANVIQLAEAAIS
jgi:NAD(P)-dependent dehydrogenase (short-subunit alcohol dehydrogenase family)